MKGVIEFPFLKMMVKSIPANFFEVVKNEFYIPGDYNSGIKKK